MPDDLRALQSTRKPWFFRYGACMRLSLATLALMLVSSTAHAEGWHGSAAGGADFAFVPEATGFGFVLFEATANGEGEKFLSSAEQATKAMLPDSATLDDIGSDQDLMGSAAGKASIRAFRKSNQSLAAAFLPLAPERGANGLPLSTAARATYNLLFQKVSPEVLEENYPISINP